MVRVEQSGVGVPLSVQQRVTRLGGRFEIVSGAGRGHGVECPTAAAGYGDGVIVAVEQSGVGVPLSVQERVTHLGGRFEIVSRPGPGTVLNVPLPLPAMVTT